MSKQKDGYKQAHRGLDNEKLADPYKVVGLFSKGSLSCPTQTILLLSFDFL